MKHIVHIQLFHFLLVVLFSLVGLTVSAQEVFCTPPADFAAYDRPGGIDGTFEAAFIPIGHAMNGNESVVAIRSDGRMVGPAKCVELDAQMGTYLFRQIKVTRTLDCVTDVGQFFNPIEGNPFGEAALAECQAGKNTDRSLQVLTPGDYEKYMFVMYDPDEGGRYYRIDNNGEGMFPANDEDIDFLGDAIALPERDPVGLQVPTAFSRSLAEGALPVEFISFTATVHTGGSTQLDWSTATETENDHFEVQRSLDGETFAAIGQVVGGGDSRLVLHYTFRDNLPGPGYNYYRLKQVDYDGSFAYSEVVSVNHGDTEEAGLRLIPNPAYESVAILTAVNDQETAVSLHDVTGRVLQQWLIPTGTDRLTVNVNNLASGAYLIRTVSGSKSEVVRLIKR